MSEINIPRLRRLQNRLRKLPDDVGFDINSWGNSHACGTTACIAGHLVLMNRVSFQGAHLSKWTQGSGGLIYEGSMVHVRYRGKVMRVGDYAAQHLGLTLAQATALFYVDPPSLRSSVTNQHAVQAIENLIQTGDPNWEGILRAA